MGEDVKFGIDNPIHNGTSYVFSPDGMSILTDEVLPAKSNIIIKIYTGDGESITVEGEVIWASTLSDTISIMGINFNYPNEELFRIYEARA
jgi:hypothetical protein